MTSITLDCGARVQLPPLWLVHGTNTGPSGVWHFTSGTPGPRVVITALMHGNEICGAVALARLVLNPPQLRTGSLIVAFLNLRAFSHITDATKNDCRWCDEDMNRVWGRVQQQAGENDSYELLRAREVLPYIDGADILLDLHSMHTPGPALGLTGTPSKNVALPKRLGLPAFIVRDRGHAAGSRLIDSGVYADPASRSLAMLLECGYHFSRGAFQTANDAVASVLCCFLGVTANQASPVDQRIVEVTETVTITRAGFAFEREFENMAILPDKGTLVARDGGILIRTPYPNAFLVMPAPLQYRRRGMTAVRFGRLVDGLELTNLSA